jgi:chromosome segregation ATPase
MNEFELKQQLSAALKERDRWRQRAEGYKEKLSKPAMSGQTKLLREEISFQKAQASVAQETIREQKARIEALLKDRDDLTKERDALKGELNLVKDRLKFHGAVDPVVLPNEASGADVQP